MSKLSTAQKQQVADALGKRRAELADEIRGELDRSGNERFSGLAGEVLDAGEASIVEMLADQDIAFIRHQVEELLQIERARQRLGMPEFGACEECGAEIGFPRLMAAPYATRCVDCQARHEQQHAHNGAPRI